MRMRWITAALFMAISILPGLAYAQEACVVLSSDIKPYRDALEGFKSTFRGEVGDRVLGTDPSAPGKIIADIKKANCKVAVALGSKALKFLKLRVSDKPIVFAMLLSPSAQGLQGREITGVYLEPSPADTLGAIKKVLPAASIVGVLYSPASGKYVSEAQSAAGRLGLKLDAVSTPSLGDAIRNAPLVSAKSDVVWMIPDLVTSTQGSFQALLESSLKNSIPLFALSEKHVNAGALAALVTDYRENGIQAGAMARRVAGGSKASTIPHQYAKSGRLVINLRSASRLGYTVPRSAINSAAEIYR